MQINDASNPRNKHTTIKSFISPIPNGEDLALPFRFCHLLARTTHAAKIQQITAEVKTCFAHSIKTSITSTSKTPISDRIHFAKTDTTQTQNKVIGIQFGMRRVFASLNAAIEQKTIKIK